jgi:hypothetical protein
MEEVHQKSRTDKEGHSKPWKVMRWSAQSRAGPPGHKPVGTTYSLEQVDKTDGKALTNIYLMMKMQ